jgi:hypothetical protein
MTTSLKCNDESRSRRGVAPLQRRHRAVVKPGRRSANYRTSGSILRRLQTQQVAAVPTSGPMRSPPPLCAKTDATACRQSVAAAARNSGYPQFVKYIAIRFSAQLDADGTVSAWWRFHSNGACAPGPGEIEERGLANASERRHWMRGVQCAYIRAGRRGVGRSGVGRSTVSCRGWGRGWTDRPTTRRLTQPHDRSATHVVVQFTTAIKMTSAGRAKRLQRRLQAGREHCRVRGVGRRSGKVCSMLTTSATTAAAAVLSRRRCRRCHPPSPPPLLPMQSSLSPVLLASGWLCKWHARGDPVDRGRQTEEDGAKMSENQVADHLQWRRGTLHVDRSFVRPPFSNITLFRSPPGRALLTSISAR